jgi:predicted nucleic acid-binding protein
VPLRVAFEPVAVERFGNHPELDDEVAGEVLGLDFAALFPPQVEERAFVVTHDGAGIRTTDEVAAISVVRTWLHFKVQETSVSIMTAALEIKVGHGLSYWDAAIVAAARALVPTFINS